MSAIGSIADNSPTFILITSIGLFLGSIIGAMANVMPFQVVLACAIFVDVIMWRQQHVSFFVFFLLAGITTAGVVGVTANAIPWGIPLFFAIQLVVYAWKTGGSVGGTLISTIAVPVYIIISVGLFYNNTYNDFCMANSVDVCANVGSWQFGFPTVWAGCVTTCQFSVLSVFGSSIFSTFIQASLNGDFVGMIQALFIPSFQSTISFISLLIGLAMLAIGLGVGMTAVTFGFTINDEGTRLSQSMGITLIMWSLSYGAFGKWFFAFGTGATWGGVFSVSLTVFFAVMIFWGGYIQGKNVIGTT